MTDQEQALLAAVIARPDDDLPRLVYADWLEEQGRAERAEFIRVQCEIVRVDEAVGDWGESDRDKTGLAELSNHLGTLRRRERELLGAPWKGHYHNWYPDVLRGFNTVACLNFVSEPYTAGVLFRRGFVEEVVMPWSYECVAALRKATPLRKCVLTTWPVASWTRGGGPTPYRLRPGGKRHSWDTTVKDALAAEFPGTAFELPQAATDWSDVIFTWNVDVPDEDRREIIRRVLS